MGDACGPGGIQTRAVWCAHAEGWTTLHTNCKQAERPSNQQQCFKVCDWHKELYDWRLGPWNQCQPVISKSLEKPLECVKGEEGIQVREITCIQKDKDIPAEDIICEYFEPKPLLEQACLIPCQQDCIVSEFSTWSECSKTCGSGLQHRTRHVVAPPQFGGSGCPNLTEFQVCQSSPCEAEESMYSLQVGPWSACAMPHSRQARQARRRGKNKERDKDRKGVKDPEARELIKKKRNRNRQNRQENKYWDIQIGYQTREVMCINKTGKAADLSFCQQEKLPMTFQSCVIAKECQVSEWSEWSPCSKTCHDMASPTGTRVRTRAIRQFPIGSEKECPELEEKEPCVSQGDGLAPCAMYGWRTTEWTECRVDPLLSQQDKRRGNQTALCGGGVQTREVYCVQVNENLLSHVNAQKDKEASKPVDLKLCTGPIPNTTQLCHIPCPIECEVSPWSAWGPCTYENCNDQQGKKGFKLRKRRITNEPTGGSGGTGNCPHLLEAIPCEEPSCYEWKAVRLGDCEPDNEKECGPGTQVQEVVCINSDAITCRKQDGGQAGIHECFQYAGPVPALTQACQIPCQDDCQFTSWSKFSSCNGDCGAVRTRKRTIVGYIEEACIIPCPSDCKLSEWSNWSRCSKSCGSGVKVRSKWLREKPYNGGRPCPKLDHVNQITENHVFQVYEVVPCHSDCNQYIWVTEPWSICKVTFVNMRDNCGEGVQTRKVSNFRQRSADPIRQPADEGRSCPDTVEKEPCNLNKNCYHYDYNVTDWSTCQLSEKAVCGNGIKTRMLDCVRSDGKSVDLKYCEELGLEKNWQMNTSCVVECPVNCQLSDWSPWSECSQTCGLTGKMIRRRTVTQPFQGDGRPCPSLMDQSKPCPVKPCYRWQYGQWSPCQVQEAQCGEGMRTRNISCVVSDGSADDFSKVVDEEFCADIEPIIDGNKKMILEETCTQPCPGDCYLKDWSSWSLCQLTCVNSEDLGFGGIQVRSRAVIIQELENQHLCPEQTLETKSCNDGQCYEYKWMASAWKGSSRTVWCQRYCY
ncbi:Thrombospondin type-1 domain-containing protein 7A [Tupaia chinensis]|uniref:Thrombospondin type-1 domain-containing protein 7A n=1 Tax=Tupaia chinensis TaxID=246437 RepID=L8YBI3_TUPCH|nr:Thrombospondin type-1 domain-containing protein 7A [Tupaia chinensis]